VSLSAIVTNHDYGRFLARCLDSAFAFCDEVLVYDDGSTDDSLDVLARYPDVKLTRREDATGGPVWGSNAGLADAGCTHLMFLDSDNWLVSQPPTDDVDYTFAPIDIARENGCKIDQWSYPGWPLDALGCMGQLKASAAHGSAIMPYPWGGVWRTGFVRNLRWRRWPSTMFAADMRTAIDWCLEGPTLAYHPEPFLVFRRHRAQWSASPERALMESDALAYAATLGDATTLGAMKALATVAL